MRVLITAEIFRHRTVTGVEQYASQLIRALGRHSDVELTLLCEQPQHAAPFCPPAQVRIYRPPLRPRDICYAFFPPRDLAQFDIIHCPTVLAPFYGRPGPRIIMSCHDLSPLIEPSWHPWPVRFYFRYLLPVRLRRVDQVIASSHSTRKDLLRLYRVPADRVTTVHLGPHPGSFPETGAKENYLLSVGTLEPRKNLKRVIEAFIHLRQQRGDIVDRLLVVGAKGWYYDDLFEMIQGHTDSIQFLGYVSNNELHRLYRRAKGLIYPSLYEGFGLPVLEALASGCPVVTSDRSSLPEIGGDAVLRVNPEDVLQIAAAMEKLLTDAHLRQALAESGLAKASQFSWERCALETIAVYKKTLQLNVKIPPAPIS
jgi:glycosyltransferase involved in cell wall biosynthesis